ncbi:hydroxyphenylacetyl-CoA thioesterase PaaI [Roseomonas sp. GC11]|uniref:hydroxyphenylacetyl-CoA thioesterase PaaI n=1 Tax=Roseomonas sp. GC11 TaxID=2950546 RepID=UPI00210E09CE|nr:hydroxyphenylacetyl-CoA thioesterase PaaI [Roseomonas sp. GC11]MCQ4160028.1 hydroxyphenylacetyl-CoA thioesterase PaaI [Roseomonas sp. GC11]
MSARSPQALAEAAAAAMWEGDAASRHLGMELLRVAPGEAEMRMPIAAFMANGHGTCHGGFLFALADSCFAFACNSSNRRAVAQACDITFLRPARPGDVVTATARRTAEAGRSGVYDVLLRGQDGSILAAFRGQSREIQGTLVPEESPC